jgi:hypothetical protein
MVLIPLETSDSFGGFRNFGIIAYAGVDVLWAAFGVTFLLTGRPRPACQRSLGGSRRSGLSAWQ